MALSIGLGSDEAVNGARNEAEAATTTTEDIEMSLLLEGIHRRYGYDFRNYAQASLRRRILNVACAENLKTLSDLLAKVLHNPGFMEILLEHLTCHSTAMFRDAAFYRAIREKVVPQLRTYPFVRIWHAGCSTGEEVYSMAILLLEEGLGNRAQIYATDISGALVRRAKTAIYPMSSMREFTDNYIKAGGKRSFSEYYTASHSNAILAQYLRDSIVFAQHNLVTDGPFNEFNAIFCRNVMIYLNNSLQDRVLDLIYDSLAMFGVLAVGPKESLRLTSKEACFQALDEKEKIYRKVQ